MGISRIDQVFLQGGLDQPSSSPIKWTDLEDTDNSYTGKEGFSPVVENGGLRLKQNFNTSDLSSGNYAKGGVVWSGAGLVYDVWVSEFGINGVIYNTPTTGSVTLSAGDATHARFDKFVVNVNTMSYPVTVSLTAVEGTPAASPLSPNINPITQAEISFRLTASGETVDTTTTTDLIYDENTGTSAEWSNTELTTGGNLAYATAPYKGVKSFNTPAVLTSEDKVSWTKTSLVNFNADDTLVFALKSEFTTKSELQIKLINSSTGGYFFKTLRLNNLPSFGYESKGPTDAWRLIQIKLSNFVSPNRDETQYDKAEFNCVATDVLSLDWIHVQGGLDQPSRTTKWTDLGDTANNYIGKAGYVSAVNSAETGFELVVSSASGDVLKVGTPVNNQLGVWTGDGTLEGESKVTFDGTNLSLDGNLSMSEATSKSIIVGNTTSNNLNTITPDSIVVSSTVGTSSSKLDLNSLDFTVGANVSSLSTVSLTGSRQINLPDNSGTLALTSEITSEFLDNAFIVKDNLDNTKKVAFDVSSVTTANTRTLVIPNESGELATKEWIETSVTSPVSSIKEARLLITAAQLKDLVANPKEIIPAPGVNKVVKLIAITGFLNFGTVAFNYSSNLLFEYETSGLLINEGTYTDWNHTSDYYFDIDKTGPSGGELSANEGVVLTTATNASVGDGVITIVALYAEQNFTLPV